MTDGFYIALVVAFLFTSLALVLKRRFRKNEEASNPFRRFFFFVVESQLPPQRHLCKRYV